MAAEYLEIPNECGVLVATLSVGVYSDEADPEAGRRHRRHTDVGTWLNRAKYHGGTYSADEALAELSGRMIAIAQTHPACADASAVVATPGSDPSCESFSEVLAQDVALGLGLELVPVRSRLGRRRSAKERTVNRTGDYVVEADLSLRRVLVIDDVFATGATLAAVAQAALAAGAEQCVGLVAARRLPDPVDD
jgi:predicted amidophosphoribosyltransferase